MPVPPDLPFDPLVEQPLALRDVPKLPWIPGPRPGKRVSHSTVFRWASSGVRGVRLEVLRIGGTLYTSEDRLKVFFCRLTLATSASPAAAATAPDPRGRARVQAELDAAGIR